MICRSPEAVPPFQFVTVLRQLYPQFAQQARGGYMQQDADELFGALLATLSQVSIVDQTTETRGLGSSTGKTYPVQRCRDSCPRGMLT
jgi:hypothetical protein